MPHWKWRVPLWSAGMEATLCIHTCLWLSTAWIPLASSDRLACSGERAPGTEARHVRLTWAVSLDAPEEELEQQAEELARTAGLVNMGRVGELKGHYLFTYQPDGHAASEPEAIRRSVDTLFAQHDSVRWHSEQKLLKRSKRSLHFNDPKYPQQWHLNNRKSPGKDINVTGVWERNVTGRGVTVVVVDDGVEHTIKDIEPNYSPEGSYDLNSNDPDPMPHPDEENGNHHGTRCAGEIAAVPNNSFCTVGVAYGSRIAGIRVLDGPLTDSMEAIAFNKHYQINDIYSCSWGPDDDGKTVDGPHQLGKAALQHGVIAGRRGFGSIFVVASGNGGQHSDNCNYDGYANSIYTVTIGAVDETGSMPFYAEECASMLAVTFSGGDKMMRSIVTTDWDLQKGTGCTEGHTGTSAAAPLAAGMIALMLQVRPCLTWRDVQHIIVFTATKYEDRHAKWDINQAGFSHSHQHGFGLLNAWRLVNAAKIWESVPYLASYVSPALKEGRSIPLLPQELEVTWNVTTADLELSGMRTLEHVAVTVTITHPRRGNLEIRLFCPSGMMSLIGTTRSMDSDPNGFADWTFSTVRCWGEEAQGMYRLVIRDIGDESLRPGTLKQWQLTLYGSSWSPAEMKERQRLLEEAMSGQYLSSDFALPCPPGLEIPEEQHYTITANTLKTLLLLGCFAVFWTFYYMLEVCLTRNNVGLDLTCNGSATCKWYQQGGKHRALESSLEMESVPLYQEKDIEDVEMECEHPEPAQEGEGDEGSWTPTHPRLPSSGRAASFHEAAAAGAGYLGREVTAELLSEDRERQTC
ncbi:proprotein convertase subtilisin/kexin type 7 isoform X1 [Accipiter gentilis]|uniref:proprotein convertase subtilisin/kexin type 7 isoform X1 n=1 Tax=Astur gentilis TaxID=8957 RepID=UPI0021101EB9|nr:proprotein convertase subtilisin/kexin type 7 isoform X1 [Accipiter gentilis]XP_049655473.1 proprotein convertase subtilisin/kexin type 7 isoform X1 [Accipiter gentilis]XP_049655474.1 proprotein convertase subtilisin/kexin type 7 isoform X1 [Accipiter gentilis]XP_049655475.1 proprotein convertase subtilisin/kexin type 7 isoform X1 [Accipiter gentilis]